MKKTKNNNIYTDANAHRLYEEGTKCIFKHLGVTLYGVVNEKNERLTRDYNEPWYWVWETSAGYRVPVPSRDIVATR